MSRRRLGYRCEGRSRPRSRITSYNVCYTKLLRARLDELNILLNMDRKDNEIVEGEPDSPEKQKDKDFER